ncbi:MAG: sodium:proton antiporter, partial [Thiomonas arsenitoxydans]|nr:sodium:proton antiporter [Thiomonas arsenitoxydans]
MRRETRAAATVLLSLLPGLASAATVQTGPDPATLSLWWGLPFAAMLLSIALMP